MQAQSLVAEKKFMIIDYTTQRKMKNKIDKHHPCLYNSHLFYSQPKKATELDG